MTKTAEFFLSAAVAIGLAVVTAGFWNYSRQPTTEKIAEAFPDDSFEVFKNGTQVTLFTLKPEGKIDGAESFQGYTILSRKKIDSTGRQFFLKNSLLNGMVNAYGAACFNPRNGFRIVEGDKTLEIVICFECGHFITSYNGKRGESSIESLLAEFLYN